MMTYRALYYLVQAREFVLLIFNNEPRRAVRQLLKNRLIRICARRNHYVLTSKGTRALRSALYAMNCNR